MQAVRISPACPAPIEQKRLDRAADAPLLASFDQFRAGLLQYVLRRFSGNNPAVDFAIVHRSGTMLICLPPRIVPNRQRRRPPQRIDVFYQPGRDFTGKYVTTSAIYTIVFSPSWGTEL